MPYRVDATMAGRHPFELFTLYLALLTSLPTVLGIFPEPGTIRALLPVVVVAAWSWVLFLGSAITLVGIYWRERGLGLILEQLGLAGVGLASAIYAGALLWVAGEPAIITGAIIGGFAVSCFRRYFQIQETVNSAVQAQGIRENVERQRAAEEDQP